jgi:hypothetical protein
MHLAAGLAFPKERFTGCKTADAAHACKASHLVGVERGEQRRPINWAAL